MTRRIQNEGPFLTVLWLGLDQKRQHLFTEVRIPGARVVAREDGEEHKGKRRIRKISNFLSPFFNYKARLFLVSLYHGPFIMAQEDRNLSKAR